MCPLDIFKAEKFVSHKNNIDELCSVKHPRKKSVIKFPLETTWNTHDFFSPSTQEKWFAIKSYNEFDLSAEAMTYISTSVVYEQHTRIFVISKTVKLYVRNLRLFTIYRIFVEISCNIKKRAETVNKITRNLFYLQSIFVSPVITLLSHDCFKRH